MHFFVSLNIALHHHFEQSINIPIIWTQSSCSWHTHRKYTHIKNITNLSMQPSFGPQVIQAPYHTWHLVLLLPQLLAEQQVLMILSQLVISYESEGGKLTCEYKNSDFSEFSVCSVCNGVCKVPSHEWIVCGISFIQFYGHLFLSIPFIC